MRDRFLHRGKRVDNGEWVQGCYFEISKGSHLRPIKNGCYIETFKKLKNGEIILTGNYEIIPETLGQCTGMAAAKSFRGNKPEDLLIYEGDRFYAVDWCKTGSVIWDYNIFAWMIEWDDDGDIDYLTELDCPEIIGTIHDNKESEG